MKKNILIIFLCSICFKLFSEEYSLIKLYSFMQGTINKGLYLGKNISDDLFTAEYIGFDNKGNFYIYQDDSSRFMSFNNKFEIKSEVIFGLESWPQKLKCNNNTVVLTNIGGVDIFNYEGNHIAKIQTKTFDTKASYYNENLDILLILDTNSEIHSIIKTSLNEEENIKNYRTPEETRFLFSENSEYGRKGITIKEKRLYVNSKSYTWNNILINNTRYIIGQRNIYIENNIYNTILKTIPVKFNSEQFESTAIHPSGDIYILNMNWQTNTHNLYYIKNTWDPEWREQWYKDHPDAMQP